MPLAPIGALGRNAEIQWRQLPSGIADRRIERLSCRVFAASSEVALPL